MLEIELNLNILQLFFLSIYLSDVSQTFFYSLVFVSLQIVNRNYIYTILYMPKVVHIWHSNWLLSEDYNEVLRSDHRCDLGIESQSQIYLVESICLMTRNTNSSFML